MTSATPSAKPLKDLLNKVSHLIGQACRADLLEAVPGYHIHVWPSSRGPFDVWITVRSNLYSLNSFSTSFYLGLWVYNDFSVDRVEFITTTEDTAIELLYTALERALLLYRLADLGAETRSETRSGTR